MVSPFVRLGITIAVAVALSYAGVHPSVAFAIASVGTSLLLSEKQKVRANEVKDFGQTESIYGEVIQRSYGTNRMHGNIIDALKIVKVVKEEEVGGDWLTPGAEVEIIEYYRSIDVGLAEGPQDQLLRVWADKQLVVDVRSASKVHKLTKKMKYTFYQGDRSKGFFVDPVFADGDGKASGRGAENVPTYPDLCHVVFRKFFMTPFSNRIPDLEFEITDSATSSFIAEDFNAVPSGWNRDVEHYMNDCTSDIVAYAWINIGDGTEGLVKFNKVTNEIIAYNENPFEGFGDAASGPINEDPSLTHGTVDRHGFLWVNGRKPGGGLAQRKWYVIDPTTLIAILPGNQGDLTNEYGKLALQHSPLKAHYGAVCRDQDGALIVTYVIGSPNKYTSFNAIMIIANGDQFSGSVFDCCWDDVDIGYLWAVGGGILRRFLHTGFEDSSASATEILQVDLSAHGSGYIRCTFWPWIDGGGLLGSIVIGGISGVGILVYDISAATLTPHTYVTWNTNSTGVNEGWSSWDQWIKDGFLALGGPSTPGNLYLIDLIGMTELILNRDDYNAGNVTRRDVLYDEISGSIYSNGSNSTERWFVPTYTGDGVILSTILGAETERAGYLPSDYDYSEATDVLHGFLVAARATTKQIIDGLALPFLFGMRDHEWRLQLKARSTLSLRTIPQEELGGDSGPRMKGKDVFDDNTLVEEMNLPQKVDVHFRNPDLDYDEDHRYASINPDLTTSIKILAVDLIGVAIPANEAQTMADKILSLLWNEREFIEFSVSIQHLDLEPLDVITVQKDSDSFLVRISDYEWGANTLLEMKSVSIDVNLNIIRTGNENLGHDNDEDGIVLISESKVAIIDEPLLDNFHDQSGYYITAWYTRALDWPGATLWMSSDGISWVPLTYWDKQPTAGYSLTTLTGLKSWAVWDDVNTLTISVPNGTIPVSSTDVAVLGGTNWAMVGEELIGFVNVTALDTNGLHYRLSRLIRGIRGTEARVWDHEPGENVILVDDLTKIRSTLIPESQLGNTFYFAAVTAGQNLGSTPVIETTINSDRLKTYAPYDATGDRVAGPKDIKIEWGRRDKKLGKMLHQSFMSEISEDYEIDLRSGSTVSRIFTAGDFAATKQLDYDISDFITDTGESPGKSLTVWNRGAENNSLRHWTTAGGTPNVVTSTGKVLSALGGQYFFKGSSSISDLYQDINLEALGYGRDSIDIGGVILTMCAYQASAVLGDSGSIQVQVFDKDMISIQTFSSVDQVISPLGDWQYVEAKTTSLAVGAKICRLKLLGGACFDDIDLRIGASEMPTLRFDIYQMNEIIGRGHKLEAYV